MIKYMMYIYIYRICIDRVCLLKVHWGYLDIKLQH